MSQLPDTTTKAGKLQASLMLVRLMGWNVFAVNSIPEYGELRYGVSTRFDMYRFALTEDTNLYSPSKMMFAWAILNWAIKQRGHVGSIADWWTYEAGGGDGIDPTGWLLLKFSPAEAQRAWLDKILSLAVEAGMVDADAKE